MTRIFAQINDHGRLIDVQVVSVIVSGDGRRRASVQTVDGTRPFPEYDYTMGTYMSDSRWISPDALTNVVQVVDVEMALNLEAALEAARN
jgi:hypothetical protein